MYFVHFALSIRCSDVIVPLGADVDILVSYQHHVTLITRRLILHCPSQSRDRMQIEVIREKY